MVSEYPPADEGTLIGYWSPLSSAQVRKDRPICLRLLVQLMRWARALARASAGNNMAAKMAMMAMTTNNSIRVNALTHLRRFFINFVGFVLSLGDSPRIIVEPFTLSTSF